MLKRLTLKTKLMASFMLIAFVVLMVGWVGFTSITKMAETTTTVLQTYPLIDSSMDMKLSLVSEKQNVMDMFTATNQMQLRAAWDNHQSLKSRFNQLATAIANGTAGKEGKAAGAGKGQSTMVNQAEKIQNLTNAITNVGAAKEVKGLSDSEKELRKLANQANEIHNQEFESRVANIYEMTKTLIELREDQTEQTIGSAIYYENRTKIAAVAKSIDVLNDEIQVTAKKEMEILSEIEKYSRAMIDATVASSEEVELASKSTAVSGIVLSFLLALGIGYFLNRNISRPISRITTAAQAIASGDLDQKLEVTSTDEIGILANAMNDMINTIKQQIGYLENIPTPVMVVDKNYNIQYVNKAASTFVNKSKEQCMKSKCYDLFKTGHCRTEECRLAQAMAKNDEFTGETVSCANNSETPIMYTSAPVKDKHGDIVGGLEFIADMSDNKKLMESIQEQQEYQSQSVSQILEEMNKFAAGDLSVKLPVTKNDEIGKLFNGFIDP